MNDIKIKVKKSEVEYCFKADNYDEFHRRFNQLVDIMYQRFIDGQSAKCTEYIINEISAADVQPVKRGNWSECYTDSHHYSGICTVCGKASIRSIKENPLKYCPKCGARMDGDDENES